VAPVLAVNEHAGAGHGQSPEGRAVGTSQHRRQHMLGETGGRHLQVRDPNLRQHVVMVAVAVEVLRMSVSGLHQASDRERVTALTNGKGGFPTSQKDLAAVRKLLGKLSIPLLLSLYPSPSLSLFACNSPSRSLSLSLSLYHSYRLPNVRLVAAVLLQPIDSNKKQEENNKRNNNTIMDGQERTNDSKGKGSATRVAGRTRQYCRERLSRRSSSMSKSCRQAALTAASRVGLFDTQDRPSCTMNAKTKNTNTNNQLTTPTFHKTLPQYLRYFVVGKGAGGRGETFL
jgi:hypothetical protein